MLGKNVLKLRKQLGLSQEQLGEKINVTRQTISNWELEETAPNPEQLKLLSKALNISIDELVENDIEKRNNKKADARIFSICGTAINFIGLVVAIMIWIEEQTSSSVAIGLILMAIGNMIFAIGQIVGKGDKRNKYYFFLLNIWFLTLIPISCIFNLIDATIGGFYWQFTPIPQMGNSYVTFGLCWLIYFVLCIIIDLVIILKLKNNK